MLSLPKFKGYFQRYGETIQDSHVNTTDSRQLTQSSGRAKLEILNILLSNIEQSLSNKKKTGNGIALKCSELMLTSHQKVMGILLNSSGKIENSHRKYERFYCVIYENSYEID